MGGRRGGWIVQARTLRRKGETVPLVSVLLNSLYEMWDIQLVSSSCMADDGSMDLIPLPVPIYIYSFSYRITPILFS